MNIEILPPPCELLGSMEGAPFTWPNSQGTEFYSLTLIRALKGEMLPCKSYKFHCTSDRMTFTSHHIPAALLHICSDPSVRKITQLHSRALCKSHPPRRYSCGPPGTSDLQMRLGSTRRDFSVKRKWQCFLMEMWEAAGFPKKRSWHK